MYLVIKFKKKILAAISLLLIFSILSTVFYNIFINNINTLYAFNDKGDPYIKWVDFNIPYDLMQKALKLDIDSHNNKDAVKLNWIELMAILSAKYYGKFSKYKSADLNKAAEDLKNGRSPENILGNLKNYSYYYEAFNAVLGGFVGEYEIEAPEKAPEEVSENGSLVWKKQYGLKVFSPIAKGFSYSDYDDFGAGRSYGYNRKHLGHDLMALTGTPVVAVESGVVEVLGWNPYGGWRIGIRSFDGIRYYYYAHLRQNRPFAQGVEAGKIVMAGDVIGYVGHTGYSPNENTNNIKQSHLHLGLQLIFDDSQKDGPNQIWIDLYDITRLISSRRVQTVRNDETKEYTRAYGFREAIPENHFEPVSGLPGDLTNVCAVD